MDINLRYMKKTIVLMVLISFLSCADDPSPEEPLGYNAAGEAISDESDSEFAMDEDAGGETLDLSSDESASSESEQVNLIKPDKRLLHYTGDLTVQVPQPSNAMSAAEKIVLAAGGFVTSLRGDQAQFKVPVATFRQVFDQLATLGRIESQVVKMQDITDEYQDTKLRIKLLQKMIARLEAMLAKATKTSDKLALLQEISGLSERLMIIEERRAALQDSATYSNIAFTVKAQTSTLSQTAPQIQLFRWLSQMSPNRLPYHAKQREIEFASSLPGFAILDDQDAVWVAETPSASRIRAVSLPNQPKGDTTFWVTALRNAIGDRYSSTEITATGAFQTLRVKGKGDYHYTVSVRVEDERLILVDAFYPSGEDKTRYEGVVEERLEAWKI